MDIESIDPIDQDEIIQEEHHCEMQKITENTKCNLEKQCKYSKYPIIIT